MSWDVLSCAKTQGSAFHLEELAKTGLEKQLTWSPCSREVVNLGIGTLGRGGTASDEAAGEGGTSSRTGLARLGLKLRELDRHWSLKSLQQGPCLRHDPAFTGGTRAAVWQMGGRKSERRMINEKMVATGASRGDEA